MTSITELLHKSNENTKIIQAEKFWKLKKNLKLCSF